MAREKANNDFGACKNDTPTSLADNELEGRGENELQAIAPMRAYADARKGNASADHGGDGVLEYARADPGPERVTTAARSKTFNADDNWPVTEV